jgi:hypothetical protein
MRKLRVSMATMVLALFCAGCADEPQQQAQLAARSTKFAATAPAPPETLVCTDVVYTGTMIPTKVCNTEAQITQQEHQPPAFLGSIPAGIFFYIY